MKTEIAHVLCEAVITYHLINVPIYHIDEYINIILLKCIYFNAAKSNPKINHKLVTVYFLPAFPNLRN